MGNPISRVTWRWPFRRLRSDIGFGAFISYSGPQDRELISKIQNGIEKLAKKWYRPPVVKVFVDKTSIAAGTRLWSRIEYGLSRSSWLILMASPEAAQSWWVNRELDWWVTHRSLDNLIIVHTAGHLGWDRQLWDFSPQSTALPPRLRGVFTDEPVWVTVPRDDHGPNVERAVLNITSAVRQMPIHELSSQAYREHRRSIRWARGAIATLSLLLVAALVLSFLALTQKRHADEQAKIALSRQLAATSTTNMSTNPRAALLMAASAYRINANSQTLAALMRADASNPKLVRYFGVDAPVSVLDGSGDGKTIVAGLDDGRVVRWSTADSEPTTVMKLSAATTSLDVSGDASVIVASDDSTADLWRSGQDSVNLPFPEGQNATAVTVSPSGRTAVIHGGAEAFGGPESNIVFDVATARQRAFHREDKSTLEITSDLVAASDDELLLFDGDYGGWERRSIIDWVLTDSGNVGLGTRQRAGPPAANGGFVTATNGSPTIPIWATRGPSDPDHPGLTAQAPLIEPGPLALSPDGTQLAAANTGSIYVAHVAPENAVVPAAPVCCEPTTSATPVREPTVELPAAGAIAHGNLRFFGDSRHLISAAGNQIALWDLDQMDRLTHTTTTELESNPCTACSGTEVTVSPDGKRAVLIAAGGLGSAIYPLPGVTGIPHILEGPTGIPLWRNDGRLIMISQQPAEFGDQGGTDAIRMLSVGNGEPILAAALAPDQGTVAAVNNDLDIFILDVETGDIRDTIPGPADLKTESERLEDAAINASADLVATVHKGTASIYDLRNRRVTGSVTGDDVSHVRFASRRLLVQREKGNLEVWDDRGGVIARVIAGDERYFQAPTADSRGKFVARMSRGYSIDIFDLDTGTLINTLPPLPDSVRTNYAFVPDGPVLVTTIDSWDNPVKLVVRDLSARSLLESACAAAGSNLSPDEWQALAGTTEPGESVCE